ncbi:MAG: nitroreductase [Gammaproteobacteria bacterium]|jgi:nitroreductase|nr:nitroreductase [Gammaproteobacteria bacterium]
MQLETVDHLLTTTRSVKRRLDLQRPVEREVIEKCLEIATQAPVGGYIPKYHFVVVTDADKKKRIGDLYRKVYYEIYLPHRKTIELSFPERESRFLDVTNHLVEHFHEVPVHIIPCIEGRVDEPSTFKQASVYGQILPAAWSLMLALRARGVGSCWTTLHLMHEGEVAELLEIPDNITQTALLPVAYFTGSDFKPARRIPARERTHWDMWGSR